MTDHLRPPGDDEAMVAYLDGELDDEAAAAFEARLAGDPRLAGRLDALAEALLLLRGADSATPPDGFEARLAARLEAAGPEVAQAAASPRGATPYAAAGPGGDSRAAREGPASPTSTAAASRAGRTPAAEPGAGGGTAPADDDDLARRRAARAGRRWSVLGAVAAAVVGVALLGGTALQSLSGQGAVSGGAEESADQASGARGESQAEAGQDRTAAAGTAPGHSGAAGAAEEREATATEGAGDGLEEGGGASVEVAFADAATPVRGAGDVRARFAGAPPGPLRSAEPGVLAEIALRTSEQVRRAPPFSSGAAPGDCLPAVLAGTGAAVTRVETVLWRGRPALAYVLVGGTAGPADAEAVVAAVPGCAELARVPLEP